LLAAFRFFKIARILQCPILSLASESFYLFHTHLYDVIAGDHHRLIAFSSTCGHDFCGDASLFLRL
jgi:hypothetical protein